ncbi:MAG TPA: HAD-IIIC family phosphatase [Candidatus Sulfotelmatobacter sp.]|nr:HAD-IIIC family phosphatase [Candidatus Sulfotelmatobacter sp.]
MTELYASLGWLPRPPADFSAQCRGVLDAGPELVERLRWLASHGLDDVQLSRLATQVFRARAAGRALAPLTPFRLGVVSNATTDFIVPTLVATALRHGIALECIAAPFGQVVQQALSATSEIRAARPDAVLVALDFRGLPLRASLGDATAAEATVARSLEQIMTIRDGLRGEGGTTVILQTIAAPAEPCFGSLDRTVSGTPRAVIDALNRALVAGAAGSGDVVLDVAGLAEIVGLGAWHAPLEWNLAKAPFAHRFLPLYADHVCRLIGALRGKSRRCLVLDLDNTLWSGVIGDDGLEGIVIGQGDATGEAHLSVQQAALDLRERGIVLAVSSKNDDAVARRPFREHPDMLLREEHIAVFQANWNDKATNLEAIANELSLGLDALVFLDDNPVERGLVRRLLPQVAVPELPDDPGLYARYLAASGFFEAAAYSAEDRARADFYRDNARRATLQAQAGGIDAYLASLEMEVTFRPFDDPGRARIAQLVNKSNQFNLTTRRYTESEIRDVADDPDCLTLQVSLSDVYGNNGMISVIICRPIADDWDIDTWLMSCRVLGRQVEVAVLEEIVRHARRRRIARLRGIYRPTARNRLVVDHYARLGFDLTERQPDGTTVWHLKIADTHASRSVSMKVVRHGFEPVEA